MPRGGKRPNSGPKKGSTWKHAATLSKEQAREALRVVILEEMREMTAAQIAQAKGLRYLVVRDKSSGKFLRVSESMAKLQPGEERIEVWEKDPSTQAFTDLMNRALDKPKEQEQDLNVNVVDVVSVLRQRQANRRKAQ